MSKKQIFILLGVFALAAAITLLYFLFRSDGQSDGPMNNGSTGFDSFFPIPGGTDSGFSGGEFDQSNDQNQQQEQVMGSLPNIPRLRMLSAEPVSGYTSFTINASSTPFGIIPIKPNSATEQTSDQTNGNTEATSTATSTLVQRNGIRYIQRATGHIYEALDFTLSQERISNTTIPKIYEAFFISSTTPIFRYLDNKQIVTYRANINELTDSTQGTFLPNNIAEIAISPNGNQFASLINTDTEAELYIYSGNSQARNIFSNFSKQWNVQWPTASRIFLVNKSDSRYTGSIYSINPENGSNEIILGEITGLTANFNSDGTKAFISYTSNEGVASAIFDVETKTISDPLPTKTFAEKCVWSKINTNTIYCAVPQDNLGNNLPQRWYQGVNTFDDILFKIDAETLTPSLVFSSTEISPNDFDIIKPSLSPDEKYFYFVNKKDLTLWSYELEETSLNTGVEQ